jgi:purine-binding chemotaxis protein CheW
VQLLIFTLDRSRYGIPLEDVVEIMRAVAVTPIPTAPSVVEGLMNVRGLIVPVFDPRRRFGLPAKSMTLSDHLIVARAGPRVVALHVDRAEEMRTLDPSEIEEPGRYVRSADQISGVAALDDGLLLIHDLATFLSDAEAESLDRALREAAHGAPGDRT